jgi:hypothetical protein
MPFYHPLPVFVSLSSPVFPSTPARPSFCRLFSQLPSCLSTTRSGDSPSLSSAYQLRRWRPTVQPSPTLHWHRSTRMRSLGDRKGTLVFAGTSTAMAVRSLPPPSSRRSAPDYQQYPPWNVAAASHVSATPMTTCRSLHAATTLPYARGGPSHVSIPSQTCAQRKAFIATCIRKAS